MPPASDYFEAGVSSVGRVIGTLPLCRAGAPSTASPHVQQVPSRSMSPFEDPPAPETGVREVAGGITHASAVLVAIRTRMRSFAGGDANR